VVRVKRRNNGVGVYFLGGRYRTEHGESYTSFGFQISIIVGSLRCCKVKEFGVVLVGELGQKFKVV